MINKIRFRKSEAEAIAAVNALNAQLVAQDPSALETFKVKRGSCLQHYILGIPTNREEEFDNGTEEHRYRMALVSLRAFNNPSNINGFAQAFEEEYTKEFS